MKGGWALTSNVQIDLSLVIPVFNECESINSLYKEIRKVLDQRPLVSAEIIFVDDGSSDDSVSVINSMLIEDSRIIVIELRRNFGQTAAMAAGFERSSGRVVVPLDGDGQNDPNDIWKLIDVMGPNFDCVSGWRKQREDKALTRKLPSIVANKLIVWSTGIPIHDSGCTIKAYDGDLLRSIPLYGEMHRLIPFYIHLAGGNITEIEVNHRPRVAGKSKYGISRTFRVLQDVIVARVQSDFARRPMHLFGNIGLFAITLGFTSAALSLILKLFESKDFVQTPLLMVASLFILMGLQFGLTGLLAEIILRKLNLGTNDRPYKIKQPKN